MRTRAVHAEMSVRQYKLYVQEDLSANAYAGDGNVIGVTTGALSNLSDAQLKAILAHEFGHHVGLHPIVLVIQRWMIQPVVLTVRLGALLHNMLAWMTRMIRMRWQVRVALWIVIMILRIAVWTVEMLLRFTTMILLFFGREAEFRADAVAARLHYGHDLISALVALEIDEDVSEQMQLQPKAWIHRLWESHPATSVRIERIRESISRAGPADED